MMGMIMIEPADLDAANVTIMQRPNYVLVAKSLLDGDADIGFFLAETYDELSETIRKQLRVLVRSQIQVISHVFLAHPRVADKMARLRAALLAMAGDEKGRMPTSTPLRAGRARGSRVHDRSDGGPHRLSTGGGGGRRRETTRRRATRPTRLGAALQRGHVRRNEALEGGLQLVSRRR
jgi:hypothetical protein